MMGRIDYQATFHDVGWEDRIPKESFWREMHDFGTHHLADDDFQILYPSTGRPSYSPVQMTLAFFIQLEKGYSDREFEEESRFDDRVKYALVAGRNFDGIDAVSLCDFRTRLLQHEYGQKVLDHTLKIAQEKNLFSKSSQHLVDSFMVEGAAARQDTYTMIRKGIMRTLTIAQAHDLDEMLQQGLLRNDYWKPEKPKIDWNDAQARQQLLEELVKDALQIVKTAREYKGLKGDLVQAINLLERVATQDVTIDQDDKVEMTKGTAKDRVISVHDPDMRHGRKTTSKKADGYKSHILTAGEEQDFVVGVEVTGANAADKEPLPSMLDQQEEKGCRPEEVMGDTAYFDPEEAETQAEKGTVITAKIPPRTNPSGLFGKDVFIIDTIEGTATCPAGCSAHFDANRILERKRTTVLFSSDSCQDCPLRDQCTKNAKGRSVTIHPYETEYQQARQEQATKEFQEKYRNRSTVERVISHLTRHGARTARYTGINKNRLQQQFAAALYNAKRIMRVLRTPTKGEVCPV